MTNPLRVMGRVITSGSLLWVTSCALPHAKAPDGSSVDGAQVDTIIVPDQMQADAMDVANERDAGEQPDVMDVANDREPSEAGDVVMRADAEDASLDSGDAMVPPDVTTPRDVIADAITPSDVVVGPVDSGRSDAGGPDAAPCTRTSCGALMACVSRSCVPARRVFASSRSNFTGNLGGPTGANRSCTNMATAAGLGGAWRAWLSDDMESPSGSFSNSPDLPYVLVTGVRVANNYAALFAGSLLVPINVDEAGLLISGEAWTGTFSTGLVAVNTCRGFTSDSSSVQGMSGRLQDSNQDWTQRNLARNCDGERRIYCFEDN
ncbi:MAG: hypothetical protein Q8Q09_04135 [Deltaproteobacteria bacterium]|nr:hypothetical protein [Deltaproteobacteria bacterium]